MLRIPKQVGDPHIGHGSLACYLTGSWHAIFVVRVMRDQQYRNSRHAQERFGGTAEQDALNSVASMRAQNHEFGAPRLRLAKQH